MNRLVDPRLTLARADVASAALEGLLQAARYREPDSWQVTAPSTPLLCAADPEAEWLDELIYGERFDVLQEADGRLWGQARRDGYVGFVRAEHLARVGAPPTHWVRAIGTHAFARPAFKSRAIGPFSLNALVSGEGAEGGFLRSSDGLFFWRAHLAPIGAGYEKDHATVAERFLGAPYLWSGRTSLGLDCSGLVQQALYACGRACPRDADQQAMLGQPVIRDDLARGDLICWDGHIAVMLDAARLIHANAHDMATAVEPVNHAIARIEAAGRGAPTAFRRL
jgi:cell wall-associated NlpC family hydrolase